MIKYNNALRTARSLLGTPYSEMDCIRLIVMIIRRTAGGDTAYRCEGTNWLWKSIENSSKYRHLTWQQEGIENARGGMLAFKRDGDDVHHVGFVTHEGTVIHSSSVYGMVVETLLDGSWHLLGGHKLLEVDESPSPSLPATPLPEGEASPGSPFGGAVERSETERARAYTSLVRDDGVSIMLAGSWRIAND